MRKMMKWRVHRRSTCSSLDSEDVRSSLEMLDNILAEYDGFESRKSASLSDVEVDVASGNDSGDDVCGFGCKEAGSCSSDAGSVSRHKEAKPMETTLDQNDSLQLVNGDSSHCTEFGPTFERVPSKKADPPPVPKRRPTTQLSLSLDETLSISVSPQETPVSENSPSSSPAIVHSEESAWCRPKCTVVSLPACTKASTSSDEPIESNHDESSLRTSFHRTSVAGEADISFVPRITTIVIPAVDCDGDDDVFGSSYDSPPVLPGTLTDQDLVAATNFASQSEHSMPSFAESSTVNLDFREQSRVAQSADHLVATAETHKSDRSAYETRPMSDGQQQVTRFNTIKRLLKEGQLPGMDEKPPNFRPPPPPAKAEKHHTVWNVVSPPPAMANAVGENVARVLIPTRPAPLPPVINRLSGESHTRKVEGAGSDAVAVASVVPKPPPPRDPREDVPEPPVSTGSHESNPAGRNRLPESSPETGDVQLRIRTPVEELITPNKTLSTFLHPNCCLKTTDNSSQSSLDSCLTSTSSPGAAEKVPTEQPRSRTSLCELQRQSSTNVFFNVFSSDDSLSRDNGYETDIHGQAMDDAVISDAGKGKKEVTKSEDKKKKKKEKAPEKPKGLTKGASLSTQTSRVDSSAETTGLDERIIREDIVKGEKGIEKKGIFKSFWKRRHASDKDYHTEEIYRQTPID